MEEVQPLQVFVRNDKGAVWGPLLPATVELLLDNGIIQGRVQLSIDGANYVFPGRMPNVRQYVPRALWGDVITPGEDLDHPAPPPPVVGSSGVAVANAAPAAGPAGPGGLRAGPGAVASAASRTAMAGPGARAAMDKRFAPNIGQPAPPPAAAPAAAAPPAAPAPAAVAHPAVAHAAVAMPVSDGTIPSAGDLAERPVLHLYYLVASTDSTGLLSLHLPDRHIFIHFRKGNPEFVDSTHPDDALATFLVRSQLANYEQLGRAEAEKGKFGGELIGALFGLGVLQPATAFTHLATRACNILMRAFAAETGTFDFETKDLPPHRAMPLGNRWAVLAEQSRRIPATEIRRRMASVADNPVMKSGGRVGFEQLRLSPHEARALSYFDGVHSLAQLAAAHPAEGDHLFRVAWMLKDLELVSFAAVKLAAPPPAAQFEMLADGSDPLEAPVELEAELDQQVELVAELDAPSPYSPPPPVQAPPPPPPPRPPPQVTAAAPRPPPAAAPAPPQRPQPARPPPPVVGPPRPAGSPGAGAPQRPPAPARPPPVMQQVAAPPPAAPVVRPPPVSAPRPSSSEFDGEIRQLQELAKKMKTQNHFEVLGIAVKSDAGSIKIAYFKLAKLYHPDTVPQGAPEAFARAKADIFARIGEANRTLTDEKARAEYIGDLEAGGTGGDKIDVAQILAAEELFQKGQIMVKARKFPEAVKILDEAITANPEEGEFYTFRGFAKFFLEADKKKAYPEAMKDISICLRKNDRCASVWYHQGVICKLFGDLPAAKRHFQKTVQIDPNHIDAQRELRMMK